VPVGLKSITLKVPCSHGPPERVALSHMEE
jgi:hypothetical protein